MISVGRYRGYNIKRDYDNIYHIYDGNEFIVSVESEREARDYIDDLPTGNLISKSKTKYCVKIEFADRRGVYQVLCTDGHYREERYAGNRVRTFDAKNKAEQALKQSTRFINYINYKIDICN